MSWEDHERLEGLLAGMALGGLDPEETSLAERALIEHVPDCASCRASLAGFREVAGDLALIAPAAEPPETLRAWLRRTVSPVRPRRRSGWATVGVAAVALGVLSGWNVFLFDRLNDTENRQVRLVDAISALGHPEAGVVTLTGSVEGRIRFLFVPGEGQMYLVGSGMRKPDRGLYRVWLRGGDTMWDAGSFLPERGVVVMQLESAADAFEHVLVTHEPDGSSPTPAAPPVAEAAVLTTVPSASSRAGTPGSAPPGVSPSPAP